MILKCVKPNCESTATERTNYCEFHLNQMRDDRERIRRDSDPPLVSPNLIFFLPVGLFVLVMWFYFIMGEFGNCHG